MSLFSPLQTTEFKSAVNFLTVVSILNTNSCPEFVPDFSQEDIKFFSSADIEQLIDLVDDNFIPAIENEIESRLESGEQEVDYDFCEGCGTFDADYKLSDGLEKACKNLENLQNFSDLLLKKLDK